MKKINLFGLTLLVLFSFSTFTSLAAGGGGGGCTFGNSPTAPATVVAGTTYNADNSSCTADAECYMITTTTYCPTCNCTFDECIYSSMGATCGLTSCFCGSPENTMYAKFCPTVSGSYIFNVGTPSCTGGAASLQWGIKPTTGTCSAGYTIYCDGSVTTAQSTTEALTGGTCYTIFFDGNAEANCTFTFNITAPVLGVKFLNFDGEKENNNVRLKWSTASEENCAFYTIEHSFDGTNFEEIGTLKGSGTTNLRSNYSYLDKKPTKGIGYYRIRQVDFDGKFDYTNILGVNFKQDKELKVINAFLPNGSDDLIITVESSEGADAMMNIYDTKGSQKSTKLYSLKDGTNNFTYDTRDLQKGVYFLTAQTGDTKTVYKFVKY